MKKYKFLITTIIVLAIITFIFVKSKENIKEIVKYNDETITKYNYENIEEEIKTLKEKYNNNDIIGTISIPNSSFSTPIVQTNNNDYYLNYSLTKEKNVMGTPFIDYRNNLIYSRQINIYGHNSSNYNPPFKELQNYLDKEYYLNHPYIELKINNEKRIYEIFCVAITEKSSTEEHYQFYYTSDEDWINHFLRLEDKSIYQSKLSFNYNDKIIVLQTCLFKPNNKFLIIVGKEIIN